MTDFPHEFQHEVVDRLARIEAGVEHLKTEGSDHEIRIRSVENKQWVLGGGIGLVGAVLGWLGYHITLH